MSWAYRVARVSGIDIKIHVTFVLILLLEGSAPAPSPGAFLLWLLAANVTLVVFNMIPAFPLDGGRMLRAVLAMVTDYARATRIAATIGQAAAVLLGILGVVSGNFILALIAVFIFFVRRQQRLELQQA